VQGALALAWKRAGSSSPANPIVHATDVPAGPGFFERDVSSSLPFCHAFPMNQFGDVVYDGVLADDERIVAFRYKVSLVTHRVGLDAVC
jgi:hypothetical protein